VAPTDATRDGAVPVARPRDRGKHVLPAMATLMALWFGMTAPHISPVAPTASTVSAVIGDTTATLPGAPDGDGG
jgi:hypothetical protein